MKRLGTHDSVYGSASSREEKGLPWENPSWVDSIDLKTKEIRSLLLSLFVFVLYSFLCCLKFKLTLMTLFLTLTPHRERWVKSRMFRRQESAEVSNPYPNPMEQLTRLNLFLDS